MNVQYCPPVSSVTGCFLRSVLGCALFLCSFGSVAAQEEREQQGDPPQSVAELCAAAREHVAKDEFDSAVEMYTAALALDPRSFDAVFGRAMTLARMDEDRRAVADFDRAIGIDPGDATAWRERGLARERIGDLDNALLDLDACLARLPDDGPALFARGRVHFGLNQMDRAQADFDRAAQLLRNDGEVLAWRGATLAHDAHFAEAKAALAKAYALGERDSWTLSWYGYALWQMDDNEEALSILRESLSEDPEDAWTFYVLAGAEYDLDRYGDALRHIDAAIAIDDGAADYHFWRSRILVALDRRAEAEVALARAQRLDRRYADWSIGDFDVDDFDVGDVDVEDRFLVFLALLLFLAVGLAVHVLIGLAARGSFAAAIARIPERHSRARYDGEVRTLFELYLKNVVLMLLTLGIYRFWAKVDLLRYRYQHTSIAEGRFDYHGTGGEKFTGFLKGLLILAPFGGGLYLLYGRLEPEVGGEAAFTACLWSFFALIYGLRPLILVGSQRFNLARTSFNNLRFHFTGRIGPAYALYLRDLLLIVCTFGIYVSWHQVNVRRFRLGHTRMGTASFGYKGQGGELLVINFAGVLLSYVTLGIYLPWWIARVQRYHLENTFFRKQRLRSQLRGIHVSAVCAPALLAVVLTLGLALPWALDRWYRLITDTTSYPGAIDLDELQSVYDAGARSTIEGIGEAGETFAEIGDLFGV